MSLEFLNKKPWHPSSMRNLQKVWEAEQKDLQAKLNEAAKSKKLEEERYAEKLKKLQVKAKLLPESTLNRIDWIYNPLGDQSIERKREEYLVGKPLPPLVKVEQPLTQLSLIFKETKANESNEAFIKLHEDPLFLIKKAEISKKQELMKNPAKRKQIYSEIQALVDSQKTHQKSCDDKKMRSSKKKTMKKIKKSKELELSRNSSLKSWSKTPIRNRSRSRSSEKKRKLNFKQTQRETSGLIQGERANSLNKLTKVNPSSVLSKFTKDCFNPNFDINKKQRHRANLLSEATQEDRFKMVETMKNNANIVYKFKSEQASRDFHNDKDDMSGFHYNYITEIRKEIYSKSGAFEDLEDQVRRKRCYLARNLDDNNIITK